MTTISHLLIDSNSVLSSVKREIQGLEALEYQMARNLEYMQQRRAESIYAQTLRGRIWLWIGKIFALYCAFRVINVSRPSNSTLFLTVLFTFYSLS